MSEKLRGDTRWASKVNLRLSKLIKKMATKGNMPKETRKGRSK